MDDYFSSFSFSYSYGSYDTGGFNSIGGSGYAGQNISYSGTTATTFDAFTSNPFVTNTTTTGYTQVESIVGTANYQIGVDYTNNSVSGFANPNTGGTQALSLDNTYYTIQNGSDAYLTSQFDAAGTIATIQTATATVIANTQGVDDVSVQFRVFDDEVINNNNTVFDPDVDFTPSNTGYRVKIDGQGDLTVSAADYQSAVTALFTELRDDIPATISRSVEDALTVTQEFQTGTTNVRVIGPGIDVYGGKVENEIDVGGRTQSYYDRIQEIAFSQAEGDVAYASLVKPADFGFDLATETFASNEDAELYSLAVQQRVVDVITNGLTTLDTQLAVTQRLVAQNPEIFATSKTDPETGETYYTLKSLFDIRQTLEEVTQDPAALQAIRNLITAAGGDVGKADLRASTVLSAIDAAGLILDEDTSPGRISTEAQSLIDQRVADVISQTGTITAEQYASIQQQVVQAVKIALQTTGPITVADLYFLFADRPPDAGGLAFWIKEFGSSLDPAEIASFQSAVAAARAAGTEPPPVTPAVAEEYYPEFNQGGGGDAAATWFEDNTTLTTDALLASEVFAGGGTGTDDEIENTDSVVANDDDPVVVAADDAFTSETSTGLLTVPEDQFTETDGGLFVANEDLAISEDDILTEDDTTVTEDPYDTRGTPYDDDGNLNPGWAINPETGEPYYIGGDYIDPSTIAQATADFEAARIAALKTLANQQNAIGLQRKQANEGDWRVRLRLAPGADYLYKDPDISADGILWPLNITDGVVFPYTPQINTTYGANYNSYDLTHSNYRGYFYQNSYVDEIQMSATFTAQDTNEANYLLAVIHFFKSVTKMFYGQDAQRGAPPPLVFLQGLGEFQFNLHPCVVKTFNYNLPADVDYIRARSVNINGTDLLQRRDRQTVSTNPLSGVIDRLRNAGLPLGALTSVPAPQTLGTNNPTYVPTKLDIQLGLLPIQTRQQVSKQFSVKSYANGDLLKGGFW